MIRLAFRAPADQAELVLAALIELAPSGLEQVDGDGFTEYAVYGAPGELPSFPEGEADVGGVAVSMRGKQGPNNWRERWKRFHEPVVVAGRVGVLAPMAFPPAVRPVPVLGPSPGLCARAPP